MTGVCIVHGGDLGDPSGCTNRVRAYINRLNKSDIETHLIMPEPSGKIHSDFSKADLHIENITGKRGLTNKPFKAIKLPKEGEKISKKNNLKLQINNPLLAGLSRIMGISSYNVDICDIAYADARYQNCLKKFGIPFVYTIEKFGITGAETVIAHSEPMRNKIVEDWNKPARSVYLVHNGYEQKLVSEYQGIPKVEGRVVFLGSLNPHLDTDILKGVASIDEVDELFIIGDGDKRDELETLFGNNENVIITGWLEQDEAFKYVASSQVALNPKVSSKTMNFSSPLKLFEYSALGTPCVVTANTDVYQHFKSEGAVVISNNGPEFVNDVKALLNDSNLRQEVTNNAIRMAKQYQWENVTEPIEVIYS